MGQIKRDCPHCGTKNSGFIAFGEHKKVDTDRYTTAFRCTGCNGGLFATIKVTGGHTPIQYPGDIDENPNSVIKKTYPEFVGKKAPQHLPNNIENFFLQATRSLEGKNFDASGMMSRKALETAVKKLNPDAKGKLYNRIEALADKNLITPDLKKWAHIIRDDGNEAAHEEEPTSPEFAKELLDFTELFLMYTFTMPGMVMDKQRPEGDEGQQDEVTETEAVQ